MRKILVLLSVLLMAAVPAQAQLEDILEEIFGGGGPQFPQQQTQAAQIDNIPVDVELPPNQSWDGHILIVTAHAAPAPNVRLAKPQFLGQTRLLLTGLDPILQTVIPTPEPVARTLDAAIITAEVRNENDTVILKNILDEYYRGLQPVRIILGPLTSNSTISTPNPPALPPTPIGTETIFGSVNFDTNNTQLTRGGSLIVRLMVPGLAGGPSPNIVDELEIDIDQKAAPFEFSFSTPVPADAQLELVAEIKDWAGRKTHETRVPMPYQGSATSHRLVLRSVSGP